MPHRFSWPILIALLASLPAVAAPAHQHGQGQLEIVLDGNQLQIDFTAPLEALVGFERAARNEGERKALSSMSDVLRDAGKVFALPAEAQCSLLKADLHSPLLTPQPGKTEHADLSAHYRFRCDNPDSLRVISTRLFERFPRLQKLEVQSVGPAGQRAAVLTPKQPRFAM